MSNFLARRIGLPNSEDVFRAMHEQTEPAVLTTREVKTVEERNYEALLAAHKHLARHVNKLTEYANSLERRLDAVEQKQLAKGLVEQ
jgi:hypothetical protein